MHRLPLLLATVALAAIPVASAAQERQPLTVDDMLRIEALSDPVFAPDGDRIAYVVSGPAEGDAAQSDIWIARWDGSGAQPLFPTLDDHDVDRVIAAVRSF